MAPVIVVTKDEQTSVYLQSKRFDLLKKSDKGTFYLAKKEDGTIDATLEKTKAKKITNLNSYIASEMGWGGQEEYSLADIPEEVEQSIEDDLVAAFGAMGVKGGSRKKRKSTASKKKRGPKKTRCLRSKRK